MGKFIDLTNHQFGRLLVIKRTQDKISKGGYHHTAWICQCECGNTTVATSNDLKRGDVMSCGCYQTESKKLRAIKHGDKNSRLYSIWIAMRRRCNNPNNYDYKYYGGRGISVCNEWNNYMTFKEWSINNGYNDNLTIDRIDTDGNYCPDNCRWVSMQVQSNNRRNNLVYTINNVSHTLSEWSNIYNIKYTTVYQRLVRGWDISDALLK